MRRYNLPKGMRYSTLSERKKFYSREFDSAQVRTWLKHLTTHPRFAVVIGRHTGIFPKEYRKDSATTILINKYESFEDLRTQILEFIPESVYYDQNIYDNEGKILGEEIAFDLDPENLTSPIHGSFSDKAKKHQGLSFCSLELKMLREETIRLCDVLKETFSHLKLVYSGRGYHVHIADKDSVNRNYKERKRLASDLKKQGFPIDEWVTGGRLRMIRLPFSLHGMVSRTVIPLELRELEAFDPIRDNRCIPQFARTTSPLPS